MATLTDEQIAALYPRTKGAEREEKTAALFQRIEAAGVFADDRERFQVMMALAAQLEVAGVEARSSKKQNIIDRNRRLIDIMKPRVRAGMRGPEIFRDLVEEKISLLAPKTLQPLLTIAIKEVKAEKRSK